MKDYSIIVARFLLKVASKDELETLNQWKASKKENAIFLDGLEEYINNPVENVLNQGSTHIRERVISRINIANNKNSVKTLPFYISRIAAVFILLVSIIGSTLFIVSKTYLINQNEGIVVSTEAGQRSKIMLPDGTMVWLNAETVLEYQQNKKERRAKLTGEAYFEVTHAADHPFFVNTGETEIKVLGTQFNVTHYPNSKITEAALLNGKISMLFAETGKNINLQPGEKVIYNSELHTISKKSYRVQNEISWKQGILYFENAPFNDMIRELERYYGVKFNYNPSGFNKIHYSGSINNLEINKVLEFINLTIPINYEVKNKTIYLKLKQK